MYVSMYMHAYKKEVGNLGIDITMEKTEELIIDISFILALHSY